MELYKIVTSGSSQFLSLKNPGLWLSIKDDDSLVSSTKIVTLHGEWCNWSRKRMEPASNWSALFPFLLCDDFARRSMKELLPGAPTGLRVQVKSAQELNAVIVPPVDALVLSKSEFTMVPGTSIVALLHLAVFNEALLEGVHLFRVPQLSQWLLASGDFVQCARQAGLRGLDFNPIPWMPMS